MKTAKPQKTDDNPLYPILIKSWIIAMLNNDELSDLARDLGLALREIETNARETATTKIEALLNAGSKTAFIVAANELKEHKGVVDAKDPAKKEILEAAVRVLKRAEDAAQRQIPIDQLPLFRALAKSDYLMAKHFPAQQPAHLS
jgi:ABC-type bacteriocin/lantibiotic exporter with double-glycine peptidase domain